MLYGENKKHVIRHFAIEKLEVYPKPPYRAAATCRLANWAEILPSGVLLWPASPYRLCSWLHPEET